MRNFIYFSLAVVLFVLPSIMWINLLSAPIVYKNDVPTNIILLFLTVVLLAASYSSFSYVKVKKKPDYEINGVAYIQTDNNPVVGDLMQFDNGSVIQAISINHASRFKKAGARVLKPIKES